jgi:small subunit ribosomal protein S18
MKEDRAMSEETTSSASAPKRKREYRRYVARRKVCAFCADKIDVVDYKDVGRLRRYLSDRARIEPRRKTGTCARHQRMVSVALKRARHLALLPFTAEQLRTLVAAAVPGRHERPMAAPAAPQSPAATRAPAEPPAEEALAEPETE